MTGENERHPEQRQSQRVGVEGALGELSKLRAEDALQTVSSLAREYPHATLAGAAAVGFILGGGLSPRLVGAIGMLVARRYLQQNMRDTIESVLHEVRG